MMLLKKGSGDGASSRAAAACPGEPSLIPLGAFFLSLSTHQWRVLEQVPRGGATLTNFPNKIPRLSLKEA